MRSFASDNNSGTHPQVMQALLDANQDHAIAYGEDPWTEGGKTALRGLFGPQSEVFFVFNGTGANVMSLAALTQSFEAVICTDIAHMHVDECGAPERIAGCKVLPVATQAGKLQVADIESFVWMIADEHHIQPRVVSITQATELGQLYGLEEIRGLADCCRQHGLLLHMDGARIANAVDALGCSPAEMTTDCGVDVLSFGGTKNGVMFGEAVVFLRPELADKARFHRKQSAQLASKMRYIGAQFEALLRADLWLQNARHANHMARELAEQMQAIGVEITRKPMANAVFARLSEQECKALQEISFFYVWDAATGEVRWMTSFDTSLSDITGFVAALAHIRESG